MLNRSMRVLLYGSNMWYLGEGMLGPLFAIFAERVGGDVLDISWAYAIYLAVTGVATIVVGKFADRWQNDEKVMVVGYALNAICTFGYLFVDSPLDLFIVQGGLGLAAALATPTWEALYAKHENRKLDSSVWGLAEGTASLTTAVAMVIGGLIVTYGSFSALFIAMGSVQVVATLYQARILRYL